MSLQSVAKKYIDMMPKAPNGRVMAMPKFVIANQLTARWNGIAVWDGNAEACTIKVQKRVMKDEHTVDRIVAHEICHAWAYWMVWMRLAEKRECRGHDSLGLWYKAAQIINQQEGDGFVSQFSDETYVEQNDKMFWVYIERNKGGIFWAWFSRITDQLERNLKYRIARAATENYQIAVVRTNDARFLLKSGKLPNCSRYSEMPPELTEKIEHILAYFPITEDSPRDIRTLVNQAKVATLRGSKVKVA